MQAFISHPIQELKGEIKVPGDKSISHRALILGSIAEGQTRVKGFLLAKDTLATLRALSAMGVVIESRENEGLVIHGVGKQGLKKPAEILDCGNSGTSMRLLAGLLAGQNFATVLDGDESLSRRPMNRVVLPLQEMGARIIALEGLAPLHLEGGCRLQGINYVLPMASAQVKSCLLLAGLYAEGRTTVIEPEVTRDHTERMLETFSYPLERQGQRVSLDSKGTLLATELEIPGDLSSAAFFIVAASLIPGSKLLIRQVGFNPTRIGLINILRAMGANIKVEASYVFASEPVVDLLITGTKLRGIKIPSSWVSLAIDEFPILAIAAACAQGETIVSGAKELRNKESDRIASMVKGLEDLNIEAKAFPDGFIIRGGRLKGGVVDSFADHRIAMAFAVAGALATETVTIKNAANVATSFPSFVGLANSIKMAVEEVEYEF